MATQNAPASAGRPAGAVELPRDPKKPEAPAWVVLDDGDNLDFGDVQDILATIKAGGTAGQNAVDMRDAILARLVKNWSYDLPLPSDGGPSVLRRLPGAAGLALYREIKPIYSMISGLGTKITVSQETIEDQASPTTGSSE